MMDLHASAALFLNEHRLRLRLRLRNRVDPNAVRVSDARIARNAAARGPIDIQDSNRRRDVIHEFPESNLELVGWPGGMN